MKPTTLSIVLTSALAAALVAAVAAQSNAETPSRNPSAKLMQPTGGIGGFQDPQAALPNVKVEPVYATGYAEGLPGTGYCNKPVGGGASTQVVFRIRNTGNSATGAFQAAVLFQGAMPGFVQVANLAPHGAIIRSVAIPAKAYPPAGGAGSANFSIRTDSQLEIDEPNEADNHDSSFCMAPPH